ncbi:zinc finger BED domain-containing protein RICESLEEPER 2-like [Bidens hawaiensis]|uniref:zinc finger BED domain-containing protein RICESLEEPER 2-like n=1 Tax=Bidens hawaiensis TaxID=980011 RepID=UPI00404B0592
MGNRNILTVSVDNASANDAAIDILKRAVKWIRQSPSRIDKFDKFAKIVNADTTKHLVLDVATRWNSTYLMLEVAQTYENTFERYDIEESVFRIELEKAGYRELTTEDWQSCKDLCHFLKPFYDITLRVSGTRYVTSNSCIEEIYNTRGILDEAIDPRNKKYYLDLLFVDRYGKKLADENIKFVMDSMHELYNEYIRIHSQSSSTAESSGSSVLDFEKYSENFNLLEWWKVNSPRFPILSLMARDLFAIPVSTVASESVFSTSGRVLEPYRSSLTPRIVESLICTQNWLRDSSTLSIQLLTEEDWNTIQEIDKNWKTRNIKHEVGHVNLKNEE